MKAAEDSILENTARRRKTASGFFFQPPGNRFGFGSGKALNRKEKIRWDGGTTCRGQEFSQTFTYDPLNRLTANTLGGVANQSWTLDSQGNWSSYTSNGTTQTQTANAQNQITSISGTAGTPVYDGNGNMTTDQSGNTCVYNAWNQLVSVSNASGQVIAQYTYNAMGYRATESYPLGGNGVAAGTTNYIYYDSQWQAIETRTGGTANSNVASQTVWSAAYINAAVLQDTYSAGVIQPNSRIYFLQDANWDTTAIVGLVNGSWQVTQRYVYSPYGTITVLNADWSTPPAGTQPMVDNLYQGMTVDSATGLYYARNRNYSPTLGRWINQDPAGYINGANTYQFVMSNPVNRMDPSGLDVEEEVGDDGVDMGAAGTGESPAVADEMAKIATADAANNAVVAAENAIAQAASQGVNPQGLAQANSDLAWAKNGQGLANDPNAPEFDKEIGNDTAQYFSKKAEQALHEPEPATKGPARKAYPDKSNAQLRKGREQANGTPWPKDPATGRNQDVSHTIPKADGGPSTLDNIEPLPHDQGKIIYSKSHVTIRFFRYLRGCQSPLGHRFV